MQNFYLLRFIAVFPAHFTSVFEVLLNNFFKKILLKAKKILKKGSAPGGKRPQALFFGFVD